MSVVKTHPNSPTILHPLYTGFDCIGVLLLRVLPSMTSEFPKLLEEALKIIIQFSTTNHSEKRISFKSKRNIENSIFCSDLSLISTCLEPDTQKLWNGAQARPYHIYVMSNYTISYTLSISIVRSKYNSISSLHVIL